MANQSQDLKTISIPNEDEVAEFGVSRFKNINGVTCYMNSILHILQQLPIFTEYITQIKFRDNIMTKILDKNLEDQEKLLKDTVVFELFRLLKISHENDDAIIQPNKFKESIGKKNDMWNEYRQQDSQEFLTFLLSQLIEEVGIKSVFISGGEYFPNDGNILTIDDNIAKLCGLSRRTSYMKREYSLLKNLFEGLSSNTKRCLYCESKTTVYEPFFTLGITIPENKDNINIYNCLDALINEDQFDSDNKINCSFCGLKNRAFNKTQIWQLPKILIIHFKRFITNYSTGLSRKNISNVDYPVYNLDLSKYFDPNSPHLDKSKFDLCGINIHKSFGNPRNINAGHYTSLVKNMINNNWHYYNDESTVRSVYNMEDLQYENAYMLFYYRHN